MIQVSSNLSSGQDRLQLNECLRCDLYVTLMVWLCSQSTISVWCAVGDILDQLPTCTRFTEKPSVMVLRLMTCWTFDSWRLILRTRRQRCVQANTEEQRQRMSMWHAAAPIIPAGGNVSKACILEKRRL